MIYSQNKNIKVATISVRNLIHLTTFEGKVTPHKKHATNTRSEILRLATFCNVSTLKEVSFRRLHTNEV